LPPATPLHCPPPPFPSRPSSRHAPAPVAQACPEAQPKRSRRTPCGNHPSSGTGVSPVGASRLLASSALRPQCHSEGERVRPSGLDDRENLAVPPVGAGSSRRRAAPARRSHSAGGGEVEGGGSPSPLNRIATSDHTATMRRGAGSPHSCHDSQGGGRARQQDAEVTERERAASSAAHPRSASSRHRDRRLSIRS